MPSHCSDISNAFRQRKHNKNNNNKYAGTTAAPLKKQVGKTSESKLNGWDQPERKTAVHMLLVTVYSMYGDLHTGSLNYLLLPLSFLWFINLQSLW